ncbi:MAG: hypothetical protein U0Y82_00060 [Thermoleophilia bacterium]
MRLTIEGSPPPEAAAAIAAAVEALMGGGEPDTPAGVPAWRLAGLREGVATPLQARDLAAARH